jgi:hypothetical protein
VTGLAVTAPVRPLRLVESSVTGRTMQNGYWDSDHAGVFSALRIR